MKILNGNGITYMKTNFSGCFETYVYLSIVRGSITEYIVITKMTAKQQNL